MKFGGDNDQITEIADSSKAIVYGPTGNYYNWLASRGVYAASGCAYFGPGTVGNGNAGSYGDFFYSDGYSGDDSLALRAVVSLISNIPETGDILFESFTFISPVPAF